jgi:hypothetical protein
LVYGSERTQHKLSNYPSLEISGSQIRDWGSTLDIRKRYKILVPIKEQSWSGEEMIVGYNTYTCINVSDLG